MGEGIIVTHRKSVSENGGFANGESYDVPMKTLCFHVDFRSLMTIIRRIFVSFMHFTLRITGAAGLGINSLADITGNMLSHMGYSVTGDLEYESRIK
jgi:hypothetical protein